MDGEETFLFLSNRRDREPNPEYWRERQSANHYPRAPAQEECLWIEGECMAMRFIVCDPNYILLWYDPSFKQILSTQRWFKIGPPSATSAQH